MISAKRLKSFNGPYYPIFQFFIIALLFLSVSRLFLVSLHSSRIPGFHGFMKIMMYGIRIDIVLAVYSVALPVLLAPFFEGAKRTHNIWGIFLSFWFTLWAVFIVVMEVVTPGFIKEYDVRPNRLFVEYLGYPREVFAMLVKGYVLPVTAGVIALSVTAYFGFRLFRKLTQTPSDWHPAFKFAIFPAIAVILFIGGRSSFGHRPISPSVVAFSTDSLVNDLALNSGYSLLYSINRMMDEADSAKFYGRMDPDRMFDIVRHSTSNDPSVFKPEKNPIFHELNPSMHPEKPMNLVIILEESMGAEFVKRLGGIPVTPNLEELSKEGLWFDNLYATGTRSVMGIEAIISGFPPTPGRSVVKLGKSQKNFFSLAGLLSQKGYNTRFIYGGDSNFDNMKGFFLGNGFQEIIDEKNYDHPKYKASWGVSDQDLFDKAHELFSKPSDKPFFSLVFSSSNHPPFEFPDNVIDLHDSPKATVANAVKYADYALGEFFRKAKKSSYYHNTIFLVVADHNSHVGGESLVPVSRFNIPGLIIGPGIKHGVYSETASQIDLPPTLLSMMGISCIIPMPGRDLTRKPDSVPGRAIMQFYKNQAYMENNQVLILQPDKKIDGFRYVDRRLVPDSVNDSLAEKALAQALWPSWVYKNQMYQMTR